MGAEVVSRGDFPDGNPVDAGERPKVAPVDSSERTLRQDEAEAILRRRVE